MKFSNESRYILQENLCFTDYTIVAEQISNLESEIERLINIIKEVRQDLLNTKRLNKHIKDKYNNEYLNMDIDHIDYLIKILDKEKE